MTSTDYGFTSCNTFIQASKFSDFMQDFQKIKSFEKNTLDSKGSKDFKIFLIINHFAITTQNILKNVPLATMLHKV